MNNYEYKTFIWLCGMVLADKGFVKHVDDVGLDAVIDECPFDDDLSDEQRESFEVAFNNKLLRLVVKVYWLVYDYLRNTGKVPSASTRGPWRP